MAAGTGRRSRHRLLPARQWAEHQHAPGQRTVVAGARLQRFPARLSRLRSVRRRAGPAWGVVGYSTGAGLAGKIRTSRWQATGAVRPEPGGLHEHQRTGAPTEPGQGGLCDARFRFRQLPGYRGNRHGAQLAAVAAAMAGGAAAAGARHGPGEAYRRARSPPAADPAQPE